MGYVSKYKGIDLDQAIEFAKNNADINEKLSEKAEALHTHKLSDITGLTDLKISWENITGKPEVFPCDGSCGGSGSDNPDSGDGGGGSVSGTVAWGNITGKPATFAPTAHTHVITDLSNLTDLTIDWNNIVNKPENIGSGSNITSISWDKITDKPNTFTPSSHQHDWDSIESKPTRFTPASHRHDISEIDGYVPGTNNGGSTSGPVSWDDILEKPDLAAKIHKHSISDVIGLEDRLTNIESNSGSSSGSGGNTGNSAALENKLNIIENDVDNLQSQVEIVQTGFSIVQSTVVAVQSTISNIQQTSFDLKEDVSENKSDIEDLKSTVKTLEQSVGQSSSIGNEVAAIKQNITSLTQKDSQLEESINDVEKDISALDAKITSTASTIDSINQNVEGAHKAIEEMQETIEQFTGTFEDQLDGAIAGSEFGTRLENVEAEVINNASNIESINASISDIQGDIVELNNDIDSITETLNDHYYIWQGEDDLIPDLNNDPAVQWTTAAEKRQHLGDFYINSLGYCYKFVEVSPNVYAWEEVQDRYIVPYARQIARKSAIFINQPEQSDSYKPGDLWINATYAENGTEIYKSETLVCIEEKLEGDDFDINHWESCNYASIEDVAKLSSTMNGYQKRVILQTKSQLFKEETWLDETNHLWIYEGLVISVVAEQKLYLLINKERYQYEDAWIEIGKTLSLTWDNITDKPDFLDSIENEVEVIKADLENLSSIVDDNQSVLSDRIDSIENGDLIDINNALSSLDNLLNEHYYIWQGDDETVPELMTEPAVQWTTEAQKREHLGDFYINSLGYCYKFKQEGSVFKWEEVQDRYVVPYARQIARKSSIFSSTPTASDSYKPGDLWINATFYEDGNLVPLYYEDTLVCIEEKLEGEDFDINHWELSNISSSKEISELSKTIENYRTRVIINTKGQLYQEETWLVPETGRIWIYEGLVISVISEQKLYLLVNKERYQYEDAWIEIGKTLSLTWDNIDNKPEFLEGIDNRVEVLEESVTTLDTTVTDNYTDLSSRINSIENESILNLENSIEDIQEVLSEHYYIWQGDDDSIPDLTNDPAVQWTTELQKREHIGDFYINTEGYCYKFKQEGNKYFWEEVQDRYIVPYARRIAGKSTIFISQPKEEDYYAPGDVWLNATYQNELGALIYDRVTLVCIQEKLEGDTFNIDDWEQASIVDKELQEIDQKVENYRTRIILKKQADLYREETWKKADGDLWIYDGLVVSVLDVEKLYLLVNVDKYQYPESWIEIGKTLSLTWENITDKPELSPSDHVHEDYENSLNSLDSNVLMLQEDVSSIRGSLDEYDNSTFPKIEENLSEINDALVGQFYIWHGVDSEVPTQFTYPEVDWISVEDKNKHVGDFYITIEGVCYKYTKTNAGFEWVLVSDRYITSYAQKIDRKSTIFSVTPTDEDEYKPGDIWVNATYVDDYGNRVLNNDIAVCTSEKAAGDIFNWADWQAILKADDVNIDNTAVTVGANQLIKGHKTFAVPVYFGEDGAGPTSEGDAYRPLYSSIYESDNNFFVEAGKRASTGEILSLNLRNTTAGPIRITSELTKDYKAESARSGSIDIESKHGGSINIASFNDAGIKAGKISLSTKGAKKENNRDDSMGILLDPETNSATIYSQDTEVTNLCDGYAEVSGYKGFAITSKATSDKNDMTGVRFKWEKEDQDGNTLNTLDIHRVSYIDGEVVPESLSIKVNGSAEVLTSANFRTYVEGEGNVIDFNAGITQPGQTEGKEDVSDLLQTAINDAISNNAKLVIKYGTYLLRKPIVIRGLNRDFSRLIIDANNALFLCDQGLIQNKPNYGGTLPDGGTQRDDLTLDDVKSTGSLFTVGTNPTATYEDDYDQGTLEFLNARIKVLNSESKRSTLVAFNIQAQKCVRFEKVSIEDFHTGFKLERCSKNPSIRKAKIVNTVFGIHSLGKVSNLTVEDVDFVRNGTAVYVDRESIGDFSCNTFSHCLFDNCNQGIYGHSKYVISALRIKSCKFNSNESFDIFLKNRIIYPTIENVTFADISRMVTIVNDDGSTSEIEEVVPWQSRANIPISIPEGYIISTDYALPSELSDVVPADSTIGGTHTAKWTKTPLDWGDNNIIITDNIFYDCHLVQIGNDKKGSHISGVEFSGNRIEGEIENCIKICSEVDENCSGVAVYSNSYGSTKRDTDGSLLKINFEVPIKSNLSAGADYMPAGGFVARYSRGPVVPETHETEEGQIGDLRWDETKAYLKTETGWKAIQFTHSFDNNGIANAWKPLETASQEPVDTDNYKVGDIVWNVDGSSRTLGWRFVKKSNSDAVSWELIEDLIKIKNAGG